MNGGPLLIVGGYGLVGAQIARRLRARHPGLRIVLAGRRPQEARTLAAAVGASTARVDVCTDQPLSALQERPAAILAAVADPGDHLLRDAMRAGIPFADLDRGGSAAALDAVLHATAEQPEAPVLLAGGWMGGLAALFAGALARAARPPVEQVALTALGSSGDRVGDGAWGFSRRWAWPLHLHVQGRRSVAHPLTAMRRVRCPDGRVRPSVRIGTLEGLTLPTTLAAPTVETRLALHAPAELLGLMALKRSGTLRMLERPSLARMRRMLLERSGTGDLTGFSISVTGARTCTLDVLDVRGQAHLTALGAVLAAERVLNPRRFGLPSGVSLPEQTTCTPEDIAALHAAGVTLRPEGCTPSELAPHPSDRYATTVLLNAILGEPVAA